MLFNLKTTAILLLSVVNSILGLDLPYCNPEENSMRRKNIMHLSDSELDRYFNAVKRLNSGPRPTVWDQYAKIHIDHYDHIHGTPEFLIWHRFFVYFMEKELQKIDSGITIPYWDWTVHAKDPNNDPIYSDKYFGRVTGDDRCVNTGPFKDFKVFYWHDGNGGDHCLRRKPRFDAEVTDGPTMNNLYLNEPTIGAFANNIEGVPHGYIHNGIGGEFSGHASPGDPLFFSHHAFVDKLYMDWQERHKEILDEYHMPRSTPIQPWGYPIIQAVDTFDRMCYYYKEEHFPWTPNVGISRSAMMPDFTPEPYTVPSNITTAEELLKHDLDYVTKDLDLDIVDIKNPPVKLIPLDYIVKMKQNLTNIRENEAREAKFKQFFKAIGGKDTFV